MNEQDRTFLNQAITLANDSVNRGGGPFGAVVVRNGEVIGRGQNRVTLEHDPSAHAELIAIRQACRHLENHHLNGCTLYASCEPCPMCLSTAYWAHLSRIVFATPREGAASAGFDDSLIAEELEKPNEQRRIQIEQCTLPHANAPFLLWQAKPDKTDY